MPNALQPWTEKEGRLPERLVAPCSVELKAKVAEQARLLGSTQAELVLAVLAHAIDRPASLAFWLSELRWRKQAA